MVFEPWCSDAFFGLFGASLCRSNGLNRQVSALIPMAEIDRRLAGIPLSGLNWQK
jgi:hypothetical protein